jgi:hypothetical protein
LASTSRHKSREGKRRVRVPEAGAPASRKAATDFPEPLPRGKRLDEELAEGYAANAELDRRIAAEFASVDYETL